MADRDFTNCRTLQLSFVESGSGPAVDPSQGSSGRGMVCAVHLQEREKRWAVRCEQQRADPFERSALDREMLAPRFSVAERKIQRTLF